MEKDIQRMTIENTNLAEVLKKVDENGHLILTEDKNEKYIITALKNDEPVIVLNDDEKLEIIAKRILQKNKRAFEELGK